jgi:hypothetical protein
VGLLVVLRRGAVQLGGGQVWLARVTSLVRRRKQAA